MAKKRDTVTPFRDKIWDLFREQAEGMDGADVVSALKQAGEEIWAVGIDKAYTDMSHQDDEPLGNAFDITWVHRYRYFKIVVPVFRVLEAILSGRRAFLKQLQRGQPDT